MTPLNETSYEWVDHANESIENPLEAFAGDWKLDHQEKFDEFLYTIGILFHQVLIKTIECAKQLFILCTIILFTDHYILGVNFFIR